MPDLQTTIVVATSALFASIMLTGLLAWCWRGWLELKRAELGHVALADIPNSIPMNRIEVADLKERVRRLEAIAAGVDL